MGVWAVNIAYDGVATVPPDGAVGDDPDGYMAGVTVCTDSVVMTVLCEAETQPLALAVATRITAAYAHVMHITSEPRFVGMQRADLIAEDP